MCRVLGRCRTALVVWGGLVLLGASLAHAKTYTVTVIGTPDGPTEQSIGATEGCTRFNIQDLRDAGLGNYRLWAGMSRLEPTDDDGIYGEPTIDQIKATSDRNAINTLINWTAWDTQFQRQDSYHFSPTCVPAAQISLHDMLAALRDENIRAVVTLRPVDDQGQPPWATALNPPRTALQDYLHFTQVTNDAIQHVYTTFLPGQTFRLYAPVAKSMNTWVEESLRENGTMIDVIDWHQYGTAHYESAVQARAWSARYNQGGSPQELYISEWGSYRSAYGFAHALTYAQLLIDHSRDTAGHVDGSAIFPWYDWQTLKGVIGADGTKTPTFYALRLMIRGLQKKTRYPVVHDIPSQVNIRPIAAVDAPSKTLYAEVLNQSRQGQTLVVDLSAHPHRGPATLRQFAEGRYDVELGTVPLTAGRVTFALPGLSIMQLIVPLASP